MRSFRGLGIFGPLILLSTARAHAAPLGLSDAAFDRYLQILEVYVLPFMVVSTVVLFCGYLASRVYHRTQSRSRDMHRLGADDDAGTEQGTEAFLRELTSAPPITDPAQAAETAAPPKAAEKSRPSHPLLRRRAAKRDTGAETDGPTLRKPPIVEPPIVETPASDAVAGPDADPDVDPDKEPRLGRGRSPQADSDLRLTLSSSDAEAPDIDDGNSTTDGESPGLGNGIPRLQAAFRRPRADRGSAAGQRDVPIDAGAGEKPAPDAEPSTPPSGMDRVQPAGLFDAPTDYSADGAREDRPPPSEERIAQLRQRADRLLSERADASEQAQAGSEAAAAAADSPDAPMPGSETGPDRREPTVSVVQALTSPPPHPAAPDVEATKARAAEIVDSLDYIASVLQQGTVLLAERRKSRQGLSLDEVRTLRVTGYDEPQHVLEDLRYLGGDAPEEVLTAYAAVSSFNGIVTRLEQMAESEPLDEGWNDLVRARVSDTIYKVGQVRKTLGIYRRTPGRAANTGMSAGAADDEPGEGTAKSVPIGRRQV